jgi:hypothetical protein
MTTSCSGWHIIQTDVAAETVSQSIDYAGRLVLKIELPSAVEVVHALLHYEETKEHCSTGNTMVRRYCQPKSSCDDRAWSKWSVH